MGGPTVAGFTIVRQGKSYVFRANCSYEGFVRGGVLESDL